MRVSTTSVLFLASPFYLPVLSTPLNTTISPRVAGNPLADISEYIITTYINRDCAGASHYPIQLWPNRKTPVQKAFNSFSLNTDLKTNVKMQVWSSNCENYIGQVRPTTACQKLPVAAQCIEFIKW